MECGVYEECAVFLKLSKDSFTRDLLQIKSNRSITIELRQIKLINRTYYPVPTCKRRLIAVVGW